MPDKPGNVGASVCQRLLNLAHARGQPWQVLARNLAAPALALGDLVADLRTSLSALFKPE
jgi:S-adenosylhomocysteine hydrolase